MENSRLLKLEEVARRLGLARSRVYMMARLGDLPVVRIGRSIRVPEEALDKWIAEKTEHADRCDKAPLVSVNPEE